MSLKYVERALRCWYQTKILLICHACSVMELAPFVVVRGCQGFIGPYPSAFLDKNVVKNCGAKVMGRNEYCQKFIC